MATQDRPRLDPETARAVIDPASYAEWDGLLDTFDRLRSAIGCSFCPVGANGNRGAVRRSLFLIPA